MRYMVFSDVHGNLPALEMALTDAGPVEGYICLGDTVDYGPWSNECVDCVTSLPNIVYIEGNHERDFLNGRHTGNNVIANAFFDFCQPRFDRYEEINGLPVEFKLNNFVFCHTILNRNIFPDTIISINHNYVIGHSHHQFKIVQHPFRLYNAGSVGQNRRYINVVNYLTLESECMKFQFHALKYDVELVISEMRRRGYPDLCIQYYNDKERLQGSLL